MSLPLIGLIVVILVALVVAYFAARTWHWGYVLVVIGIVLSTAGFFLLAAETLRIQAVLRKQVNELERQLADVRASNDALVHGTDDPAVINRLRNEAWPNDAESPIGEEAESIPSLAELEHQLHLKTRARGRVWRNVAPAGFNPQSSELQVNVAAPSPAGILQDSVVFLFEAGEPVLPGPDGAPRGPQYLGEFRVSEAAPQGAKLEPVLPLDDFERQRLARSQGPWVMYEVMPADSYDIFAGMTEDVIRQKLPPRSVDEYLRHGKEASADDDEWHKIGVDETGKRLLPEEIGQAARVLYQRRLRDYALEFDELAKRRAVLVTDLEGVKRDIQRLEAAQASAKELQAFREDEKAKLTKDLAGVTKERQAIEAHLAKVRQQLARAEALLAETLERNRQMAQELAARQSRAIDTIESPIAPAAGRGPLALGTVN
jgi:hypothetical protein